MSELVEPMARAIAAHKRRLPPDHPEIDRVWSSYCGQVRAALSVLEPRIEALERELAEAREAERFCRECGASVAVDPSFMACHCRTMIWPIRNGEAAPKRPEHDRA